jgi:hypothetical protein
MRIQAQKRIELLDVNTIELSYVDVNTIELSFVVDIDTALANNVTKATISAFDSLVFSTDIVSVKNGEVDADKTIENILTRRNSVVSQQQLQSTKLLTQCYVDLTKYVNNSYAKFVDSGISSTSLSDSKPLDISTSRADSRNASTVNFSVTRERYVTSDKNSAVREAVLQKKDPTSIIQNQINILAQKNLRGVISNTVTDSVDKLALITNTLLSSSASTRDGNYMTGFQEKQKNVRVSSQFVLDNEVNNFLLKIDFVNGSNNMSVFSYSRNIDLSKHKELRNNPSKPPVVKLINSEFNTSLSVVYDNNVDFCNVYRRNISTLLSTTSKDYEFVGQARQGSPFYIDKLSDNIVFYRLVPVKNSVESMYFTNIVASTNSYVNDKSATIEVHRDDDGVVLEVRNLPREVVSVKFMRRNMSTFEKDYVYVDNSFSFVNNDNQFDVVLTAIDSVLTLNHVYEYVCYATYKNGTCEKLGSVLYEHIDNKSGTYQLKLANVKITKTPELDVSFDVAVDVKKSNVDQLKNAITSAGNYDEFKDVFKAEREKLSNLVVYSVTRMNLTTGEQENLGIVSDGKFTDSIATKTSLANVLRSDCVYRYIVRALARDPFTFIDSATKTLTDKTTGKSYTFNVQKYMHPVVLSTGNVINSESLRLHYAKDEFSHGDTGVISVYDVSFSKMLPSITEFKAIKKDSYFHLTWKILGDVNDIDHVILLMIVDGRKYFVSNFHLPIYKKEFIVPLHNSALPSSVFGGKFELVVVMKDFRYLEAVASNLVTSTEL